VVPERESIRESDWCDLASRWRVDPEVMRRLSIAAEDFFFETRGDVRIISGYRTAREQRELERRGRPTAPDHLSTHRSCPATGVDVNIGVAPVRTQKWIWARILRMNGLEWGGRSKLDSNFIPVDWQHVDRGPRT